MTLIVLLLSAAAEPTAMGLDEVLQRASNAPVAQSARADADRARAGATIEWRQALLPTLGGQASIIRRDRTLTLDTGTELGAFEFGPSSVNRGALVVTQPLLDPARLFYRAPAASGDAEAAELTFERERERQALVAAGLFFDVLSVDAQLRALAAQLESLQAQRSRVLELVSAGRALDVDRLRIELTLDDVRQQQTELKETKGVLEQALGQAVDLDGPVRPDPNSLSALPPLPPLPEARERASDRRDLQAIERRISAAEDRSRGVWAELIPSLNVSGSYIYDDGAPWDQNQYLEGAINLSWAPFAAATRSPRAQTFEAEARRFEAQYTEARRGILLEVKRAHASLTVAEADIEVARRGVAQAEETLRVEKERYSEGRTLITEVLEAEGLLAERRARLEVANVEVSRAVASGLAAIGGLIHR